MTNTNEVSVLFICSSPKKYRLVVKQLAQDGWAVSAVGNVKKGLQIMMQKKPTHVFISANTPGIALLKIAKIVTSTFKIPVILFAENQDFQTSKIMRETKWQHTLPSGLSAVAVRNKIRALSGEDSSATPDANSGMKRFSMGNNSKDNDTGVIRIEGNKGKFHTATSGTSKYRKSSSEDLHEEGSDVEGPQLNSKARNSAEEEDVEGGFYYDGKKVKQVVEEKTDEDDDLLEGDIISEDIVEGLDVLSESGNNNDEISKLLGAFDESGEMIGEVDATDFDVNNGSVGLKNKAKSHGKDLSDDNSDDDELSIESNQQHGKKTKDKHKRNEDSDRSMSKGTKRKSKDKGNQFAEDENDDITSAQTEKKSKRNRSSDTDDSLSTSEYDTNVIPFNKPNPKKNSIDTATELDDTIDFANEESGIGTVAGESKLPEKTLSEVRMVIEKTLNQVVNSSEAFQNKVDKTSDFVAFFVNSKEFSGLVYMAVGKNNAISSGLVGSFMKTLSENFQASSIEAYVHRPVSINVKPLDIRAWMKEKCDFKLVTSHLENEVILGFIADNNAHPLFAESAYDGMFHVDVKHFPVNYTMNMDLFVYLPLNKKAIKYISKGGYLDKKQKTRLVKNEISAFHILNEEILTVRDFFVKLYTKSKLAG